ncbi:MAG: hypothetical protein LM564_03360 [Desulfurococcaceae archaeon]|nr:hypothetical protein [Desulfurococcaceae archaeon]
MLGTSKRYVYRKVNLTKNAEKVLSDIEALLGPQYSRPELVEVALLVLYHILRKRGYRTLAEVLQHLPEIG